MKKALLVCAIALIASLNSAMAYTVSAAWTSASAVDSTLQLTLDPHQSAVSVEFAPTGTITAGSITFEVSRNGTTWYPVLSSRGDSLQTESTFSLNGATKKAWRVPAAGFSRFQVRLNPVIVGSGTANLSATPVTQMVGPQATISPLGTGISTGTGIADTGTQRVIVAQKATYAASTTAKTATAAGTGPFFALCGSSTKTVRLQYLEIDGTVATAAVYGDVILKKTSTATSAGTATALTKTPLDSGSAASTASAINYYTALATAGTLVGTIGSKGAVFPITGTVAAQMGNVVFDWTNRQESQAPTLSGTAQCIEASFGTTTTNAPTLTVYAIYTEE